MSDEHDSFCEYVLGHYVSKSYFQISSKTVRYRKLLTLIHVSGFIESSLGASLFLVSSLRIDLSVCSSYSSPELMALSHKSRHSPRRSLIRQCKCSTCRLMAEPCLAPRHKFSGHYDEYEISGMVDEL